MKLISNKNRGWLRISVEVLEHVLQLPPEVEIIAVEYDAHSETFAFKVSSPRPVPFYTWAIPEGYSIPYHSLPLNDPENQSK